MFCQDFLETGDIPAGPNDPLTETLLYSKLRVNIVTQFLQNGRGDRETVAGDRIANLLRSGIQVFRCIQVIPDLVQGSLDGGDS